jgi:hypothetical protein
MKQNFCEYCEAKGVPLTEDNEGCPVCSKCREDFSECERCGVLYHPDSLTTIATPDYEESFTFCEHCR